MKFAIARSTGSRECCTMAKSSPWSFAAKMAAPNPSFDRVTVDGKFFRLREQKLHVKGITYGPFAPNAQGDMFASPEQTERDFQHLRELGANVLRVYYVPPNWLLDLAAEHDLKLLVDVPWPKHVCFLESFDVQEGARKAVRDAVRHCKDHPAIFAYSVVNEIPAEIVRWSGAVRVAGFIDELIAKAKTIDADCLCTFASFPPTEFLLCRNLDFVCFNIYLHQPQAFERYLARLQTRAESKPLLLGEFGLDSVREGEDRKCELLSQQVQMACRAGLAGTVVYSYTDDWFRGGQQIENWAFGLTTRDRQPKKSFYEVQRLYSQAPLFPLPRSPRVSVVVASYNGGRTLEACLSSLNRLHYPAYEVILVDDGSTDNTQEIVKRYPSIRNLHQPNRGLSAARNTGIEAATGEIVAFTDSDCRADEDWLYYLVGDLIRGGFTGIGGHNFLPADDSPVAAAVLVSPGGPAHVMLTDEEAEHIPGCNMAFYKWALAEINGFDPRFRKAGDDVDVCWRLLQRGYKIGFSPAGFVWHYRRSTIRAYLKQQTGYGEAEALLVAKHPECFNAFGGSMWRGRIYTAAKYGLLVRQNVIYHGIFGSGFFQKLYAPEPAHVLMLCTSLEYHAVINLTLMALSPSFPVLLPPALTSLALSLGICVVAGAQADLPRTKTRFWSRPLVASLFFLQPIVRGWARYRTRLNLRFKPEAGAPTVRRGYAGLAPREHLCFWSLNGLDRMAFLGRILDRIGQLNWEKHLDTGWDNHDVEIVKSRWSQLRLTTVGEHVSGGRIFLRCRLEARWSLLAKMTFFAAFALQLLLIDQLADIQPWIWMVLTVLPLMAWFFDDERKYHQTLVADMIERSAEELKLQKYEAPARAPGAV